jgi:ABC-type antimicrobial peptide transport system permease subunit
VYRVRTLEQVLSDATWNPRLSQHIITIIALIGLLLSMTGLYAVTARGTEQCTREIGVRIALGARRAQITWLVLRRAMTQLAWGLLFGVVVIAIWNRPWDPPAANLSFAARFTSSLVLVLSVSVILIVTALVASLLPARRAARLDPTVALRHE